LKLIARLSKYLIGLTLFNTTRWFYPTIIYKKVFEEIISTL